VRLGVHRAGVTRGGGGGCGGRAGVFVGRGCCCFGLVCVCGLLFCFGRNMDQSLLYLLNGARDARQLYNRTLSRMSPATGAQVNVTLVDTGSTMPVPVITAFSADGTIRDLRPLHYQDPQRLDPSLAVHLPGEVARRSLFLRVDDGALLRVELVETRDNKQLVSIFGTEPLDVDEFTRAAPADPGGASSAMINTLKRVPFEKPMVNSPSVRDSVCMICFENIPFGSTLLQMPCKHRYHEPCLRRWLLVNNSCPICRMPLSRSGNGNNRTGSSSSRTNSLGLMHSPSSSRASASLSDNLATSVSAASVPPRWLRGLCCIMPRQ